MALAIRGGHRECVRLLQAAGWPAQRAVADDADGRDMTQADGGPCDGVGGTQMMRARGRDGRRGTPPVKDAEGGGQTGPEGRGRGGVSDGDEDRRCSSSVDDGAETSTPTSPPAGAGKGGGENGQRTRVAPPAHAHPCLQPTPAENASPRCQSVAAKTPSATARASQRVVSVDVALPGLQPEGTAPSYSGELFEPPVSHTPRPFPHRPGGKQLCDRSTPPCGAIGPTDADTSPAVHGPRPEGVDTLGIEGFSLEEWRWFSEGANGMDDRNGCRDGKSRRGEFLGAEEALAAGGKSRVRDVWSPISGAAGARGARLNLGALAEESREPVVSAYLAGLLRGPNNSLPATRQCHHRTPQAAVAKCGIGSRFGARPPPRPHRLLQQYFPSVGPPTPLPPRRPSRPGTPLPPSVAAAVNTAGAARARSAGGPRRSPWRGDDCAFSRGEQRRCRARRHLRRCTPLCGSREPQQYYRRYSGRSPGAPGHSTALDNDICMAAGTRLNGRARSAPEHSTAPPLGPCGCARDAGRSPPHERWDWYEDERVAAVGAAGISDAARRPQQPQRVGPSGYHAGCRGEDPEIYLLCRGRGKWPPTEATSPKERDSMDKFHMTALAPPSPGFEGGCGEKLGSGCRSQRDLIPRNMFLTRMHRTPC